MCLSEPGFGKIIGIEGMIYSGPVQLREAGFFSFTDSRRLSNRAVRPFDQLRKILAELVIPSFLSNV